MSQAAPTKTGKTLFTHLPSSKLASLALGGLSLGLLLALVLSWINSTRVYRLKLAAGDPQGESYVLSRAIEAVVEAEHPRIQIEVVQTGGTSANLQQLADNEAQLATAQADAAAPTAARTVAVLYRDLFQLVVKDRAGIEQFADLQGKTIGLQQQGGQFRSFLEVAEHYGLQATDFRFVGDSDQAADQAFQLNQAVAVFRVRAAGNRSVAELVQRYQGRLIGIEQAAAMKIKHPAFLPDVIPQGAYRGNPPVPERDLNTIAVERLLLARQDVPDAVVRQITAVINERRQQIADQIQAESAEVKPLTASIRDPRQGDSDLPIHAGALSYYERNRPSFVQENADFLALLLTVGLLFGSWLWELKNWVERRKKDYADRYIKQTLDLMKAATDPDTKQQNLDQIYRQVAADLVDERISQESFRTFNDAYKTARETIEREKQLTLQSQREVSAAYIKTLIQLMQDKQRSKDLVQQELDQILEQASTDLVQDRISQESFRTFVEAYKTTRDAVERKP
ncbi:MAG: TAXI family TRAP transporter solute-binding subunit [Elainella sp.]